MRSTLPTRKIYEQAPAKASIPIKDKAGAKFPSFASTPKTIGITMEASWPMKLKTPPVSPISVTGAIVETKTQEIEAKPFAIGIRIEHPQRASPLNCHAVAKIGLGHRSFLRFA